MAEQLTGDAAVRARVNDNPVWEPPFVPFTRPRPLAEARVAIVTTAGLTPDGRASWAPGDESFTVLDRDARNLTLAHFSPNFDRVGIAADLNVVYPIDRLEELAADGTIGSVAPRHVSFMGAQLNHELSTMRLDTGPAVARMLREDGVDVVLLTPI